MEIQKVMLKPSDVAPMLGVTTGRVYQLIASGVLPSVRSGRSLRIPRVAWETWLRKQSRLAERQQTPRAATGRRACA